MDSWESPSFRAGRLQYLKSLTFLIWISLLKTMTKKIDIIGMRHDLGQNRRGVDMGPSAIRFAKLNSKLSDLGYEVIDNGDIECSSYETGNMGNPKLRFLEDVVNHNKMLKDKLNSFLKGDTFPLVLGGDHSITLGVIAGMISKYPDMGLIYMDAHGDFNTTQTTPSGNIHGMTLAAITGRGDAALIGLANKVPMIKDSLVHLIGVRKLDKLEKENIKKSDISVITIKKIDELGISEVITQAINKISQYSKKGVFHFSLDIDSIEPAVAPGTGTTVRGGLTYREAHLACELIAESDKMVSMDVVEVNPILDHENQTGRLAVELILSALGKTIL
ncbi:MAG: Arginase [Promethearchaeota archaeon]|nr:MAG: Arginase [Candidatus Lokiarchaeota archaeon]